MKSLSHIRLFVTPWTVAYQAPQSMGFSRQKYWSGSLFPSLGDLPDPGNKPGLLHCRQMLYHPSHQENGEQLGDTHRLFSSLEALLTWRKGGRPVNLGKKRRIAGMGWRERRRNPEGEEEWS